MALLIIRRTTLKCLCNLTYCDDCLIHLSVAWRHQTGWEPRSRSPTPTHTHGCSTQVSQHVCRHQTLVSSQLDKYGPFFNILVTLFPHLEERYENSPIGGVVSFSEWWHIPKIYWTVPGTQGMLRAGETCRLQLILFCLLGELRNSVIPVLSAEFQGWESTYLHLLWLIVGNRDGHLNNLRGFFFFFNLHLYFSKMPTSYKC